jgi:hypothetical protein
MNVQPVQEARQAALSAVTAWHEGKLYVEHSVAVSNDALHIIIGVLFWLGLAIVLRRTLSSLLPWAGVAIVLIWNEIVDLCVEQWPDPAQQYGEGAKDVLLTLLVPTLIMLAVRYRPQLFRHRS